MRKKMYVLFDCEFQKSKVYNVSGIVVDKQGNIYEQFNFLIKENIPLVTKNKKVLYFNDFCFKELKIVDFNFFYEYFKDLQKNFNIFKYISYNVAVDYSELNRTSLEILHKPFIDRTLFSCLQKLTEQTIYLQKSYSKFCFINNYLTPSGKLSLKAENIYRYITLNTNFNQEHTALSDVIIEQQIFNKILRQHKALIY